MRMRFTRETDLVGGAERTRKIGNDCRAAENVRATLDDDDVIVYATIARDFLVLLFVCLFFLRKLYNELGGGERDEFALDSNERKQIFSIGREYEIVFCDGTKINCSRTNSEMDEQSCSLFRINVKIVLNRLRIFFFFIIIIILFNWLQIIKIFFTHQNLLRDL